MTLDVSLIVASGILLYIFYEAYRVLRRRVRDK